MKRLLLPIFTLPLFCAGAQAAPVSRSEALATARDFLASAGATRAFSGEPVFLPGTDADYGQHTYHIFNLSHDKGFVVVSGDDRTRPILAYGTQGNISEEEMPDVCRGWLSVYDAEIRALGEAPASEGEQSEKRPAAGPLLQTRWNQKYPFNILCPDDSKTGFRCVTGCVATATAQTMGYYRYPDCGTGSISYSDTQQGAERTFNFSGTPFDWDNILPSYDYASPAEKCNAVATLMLAAGHAVRTQYSPDNSMAYHRAAGEALRTYFGYGSDLHYYEREAMSAQEWEDIIYNEVAEGRPVIYDGHNPAMGHTFVCDGYDGEGLFHFNWGWGGNSDGYFALSALNPSDQGAGGSDTGYSAGQCAICRIAPAGTLEPQPQTEHMLKIYSLYFGDSSGYHEAKDSGSVTADISSASLFFYCMNRSYREFDNELHAVFTKDGKVESVVSVSPGAIPADSYAPARFPLAGASLADGTYTVTFTYLTSPDEAHAIYAGAGDPDGCTVTVSGSSVTMAPASGVQGEDSGISLTEADTLSAVVSGTTLEVTLSSPARLSLTDLSGTVRLRSHADAGKTALDVSSVPRGVYILSARTAGGVRTLKLII